MVVRIKLKAGKHSQVPKGLDRKWALAFAALLNPAGFLACSLAVWRIGADLKWMGQFAISDGLFSHWQVWLAMGIALFIAAGTLSRYGMTSSQTPFSSAEQPLP